MAKVILMYNKKIIDQFELDQGDMKIGRRPDSDILIDNMAVSGEHANIFTIGEDSFIQDLGSTNGTFVNNKQITKHHLKHGDAIEIGKHTLSYVNESQSQPKPVDDFAKTVIITPPGAGDADASQQRAGLYVLSGPNSGKRIEVSKRITNLGRTGKRAGTITRTDEGFVLAAGDDDKEVPKLNGRLIPKSGVKLKNGDVIEVAGTRLQFQLK